MSATGLETSAQHAALIALRDEMRQESAKTATCYTCYTELAALVARRLDAALALSTETDDRLSTAVPALLEKLQSLARECGECRGEGVVTRGPNAGEDCADCADIREVIKKAVGRMADSRPYTDIDALRAELAEARAAAKIERELRARAEKRLAEANQEIGRLRAMLKQDER